ncbi:error-prone DNA polymerase [Psychromicrobium xiongbiense]|uniref:error-prone DNA polymerase n=1 Tax=Psychromicrobium xiongbiense TaxID=3051184 RepID=UPI002556C347|nr:error-prone DNA polymerase [Psychromicrobium sp. YIM S02556]
MGWYNPQMPWGELERTLSGRPPHRPSVEASESPRSRKRPRSEPKPIRPPEGPVVPYAELHVHSHFSFLDGASSPAELVEEAVTLGLTGLALSDHDGLYGAAQFAEVAENYQDHLLTIYGAELSLGLSKPQGGEADPEGDHLLLLARGVEGYHRLSAAITAGQLAKGAEKGRPVYAVEDLAQRADGHWVVLTGCRKGLVRRALAEGLAAGDAGRAARVQLFRLVELFGEGNVVVELYDHGNPQDSTHNDHLAAAAAELGLPVIASNNVHYASPSKHRLAAAMAAVRARRSVAELDGWLPAGPGAFLRSGAEMARRFARFPGAVERTVELARELAFPLTRAKPRLPVLELPEGHTQMSHLREMVWAGAATRYPDLPQGHRERLEEELAVIEQKDFPGYFLIVERIVAFAKENGILCQGRGSAAASAVCYCLGITAIDPIFYQLPFERFLNTTRNEEPDIDIDFDARRREEVIQHVYDTYGRLNAAQVCNVISYRPKAAIRDMAKALGYSPGQQDAWSQQLENPYGNEETPENDIPQEVWALADQVRSFPRHLGIHSGGMVLTDRPVSEICPIENARREKRTVLQWDKDDCAYMGLVKFDLLGLGMLSALQHCFDLVAEHCGERWTLEGIPKEEKAVYDQLCLADTIGVFQVESRAQISMLPRLKPREFYDLVIEVALVRPGPIQGGAVHPYMRNRTNPEDIRYQHELLRPVLEKTCGVPIFQEQLMQMATAVGDCGPEEADQLRRSMGSKRGVERIGKIKDKLFAGMRRNGLSEEDMAVIYGQIEAFANFGFAESHALSFALLVYKSSWLRLHYPGAFLASLLRAQPMGFYAPRTLVEDARRHGVVVRGPDLHRSGVQAGLEPVAEGNPSVDARVPRDARVPQGRPECLDADQPATQGPVGLFDPAEDFDLAAHRRDGDFAVRLGLDSIKSLGDALAQRIVEEREHGGPFRSMADLARRVEPSSAQLEALATSGALDSLTPDRRAALWEAAPAAQMRASQLPGLELTMEAPQLPIFTELDQLRADLESTGISPEDHPLKHVRAELQERGVLTAIELRSAEPDRRVTVAGVVTHRQRPQTSNSITFLNLEDETGLVNVVCTQGAWARYRRIVRGAEGLLVRGILERSPEGVIALLADGFEALPLPVSVKSRDFR